jgi:hypothetical protein
MDTHVTTDGGVRQTRPASFQPDHTRETADPTSAAVQSGPSSPDGTVDQSSSSSTAGASSEPKGEGCTCGFCDGVTVVPGEDYDPRTGEADVDEPFERMSRRSRCPRCGGINVTYRDSYCAHAADLVARTAGKRNVYGLHVTLDSEAVQRAGIDPEETYHLWTGDGAPWTRARRAMKRRDDGLIYLGTLSARSDGTYHLHLLVVTRLSVVTVGECLQVAGLDAYVQDFDRAEADSKERFAVQKAGYAFRNTARSPSSRFVSSRTGGAGYDSSEAKERRREAVDEAVQDEAVQDGSAQAGSGDDPAAGRAAGNPGASGARGPKRNQRRDGSSDVPESGVDPTSESTPEADSSRETAERAPPVRMEGRVVGTDREYRRVVKRKLMERCGGEVHVNGLGRAVLVKVAACEDDPTGLVCTVVPEVGEGTVAVRWRQISARNAPRIRRTRSPAQKSHVTPMSTDETEDEGRDPVERFNEVANESTVTFEMEDGRRHEVVKDHRTGQTRERVKPPRNEHT